MIVKYTNKNKKTQKLKQENILYYYIIKKNYYA